MRHGFRLGDFEPVQPQDVAQTPDHRQFAPQDDDKRLMREAKHRMRRQAHVDTGARKLSKVERAMRRNAPDLMPDTKSKRSAERPNTFEHRWPRPRLIALIVIFTLAAVVPSVTMRLVIWGMVMFLLTAVLLGPERARDGVHSFALHMSRVWGQEIGFVRRLLGHSP